MVGEYGEVLLMDWGWPGVDERRFTLTDLVAGRLERALAALPERDQLQIFRKTAQSLYPALAD